MEKFTMRKAPSTASMTLVHRAVAQRGAPRLLPPSGLPAAQNTIWHQTVDALPPDWFAREHEPLLLQYCNHVARAAQIEAALSRLDPVDDLEVFDKLTKLAALESSKIAAHARGMRLTQQSRLRAETASNRAGSAASTSFAEAFDNELLA
jgi:hypothetical protein